jgi:hypothetical protein
VVRAQHLHPLRPPTTLHQGRNQPLQSTILQTSHNPPQRSNVGPHGISWQPAIAKTYAKRSAWQIPILIVLFVILVFKV